MRTGIATDHVFVVLAYKESPFLAGTLRTLAAQTSGSEIVVTTSTPSAHIKRAAQVVGARVIVNPNAAGIGADWNFGLTAVGRRFVTLAHQDDTYAPAFAEASLAALRQTQACLAFTGYQEIDDAGRPVSSKISKVKHLIEVLTVGRATAVSGLQLRAYLSFGNPLPCSSVTFDRRRLPEFRFSEAFASNLDWDAWWRLMESGEVFARVPARLVGRRHNAQTATSRLLRDGTRAREDLAMFRKAWPKPLSEAIALAYRAGY